MYTGNAVLLRDCTTWKQVLQGGSQDCTICAYHDQIYNGKSISQINFYGRTREKQKNVGMF